jgi:outer membrane lipoprotein SlyB
MRVPLLRIALACALLGGLLSACSTGPLARPEPAAPAPVAKPAGPSACTTCGQVERIETLTSPARKPVGPMQGGILGGVLSKPAAASTSAAPAPTRSFRISLRLDDGRRVAIYQASISPNLKVGSRVRVEKGRVILLR